MQTKTEYYQGLIDRVFMRLEPAKMTIVNDGMYRDRLVVMTRAMIGDLERENDPDSKVTISELTNFANQLEETIEQACENLVLAPIAIVESPPADGTIEWLKTLTDRLDEELVYPELDLFYDIVDILIEIPEAEHLTQIDLLLQADPSLLGETLIEAIEIWTSEKIEELDDEIEPDWDKESILFVPIQIGGIVMQLSKRYGANAWKVAIGCYEIVAGIEGDEEKLVILENTLKSCREALAASNY